MSSLQSGRAELLNKLSQELGQELGAREVMFHSAIAERLGLNATDHKCLDILLRRGPVTAGELAELTGLTTGAITGIVDRLEKAGFVRRQRDPSDRRRVIVRPLAEKAMRELGPLFESLAQAMAELCRHYSDQELAVIVDFITEAIRVLQEETTRLHAEAVER